MSEQVVKIKYALGYAGYVEGRGQLYLHKAKTTGVPESQHDQALLFDTYDEAVLFSESISWGFSHFIVVVKQVSVSETTLQVVI